MATHSMGCGHPPLGDGHAIHPMECRHSMGHPQGSPTAATPHNLPLPPHGLPLPHAATPQAATMQWAVASPWTVSAKPIFRPRPPLADA